MLQLFKEIAFVNKHVIGSLRNVVDNNSVVCSGPVGTMFTATLMPKVIKKQTKYTGPFLLKSTGDFVEKGKQYLLDVLFQPTTEGNAEAQLILEVEQNPYQLVVYLKGYGQYPSLQIHDTRIDFGAILPYDIECERQLFIKNISPFPVEFYFPDFDLYNRLKFFALPRLSR